MLPYQNIKVITLSTWLYLEVFKVVKLTASIASKAITQTTWFLFWIQCTQSIILIDKLTSTQRYSIQNQIKFHLQIQLWDINQILISLLRGIVVKHNISNKK